jgi:hypothetical protein
MILVARLDNILFFSFPYYHRCHKFITCLNYDEQKVMLQVTYEHKCANPNWKLDLFGAEVGNIAEEKYPPSIIH